MFLINPLFVISNVIYIKPSNRYILVEKSCWNTIVRLVFRGRRPSRDDLRKLKDICYTTYVMYTDQNKIDYPFFNSIISKLQNPEVTVDRVEVQTFSEPIVELELNDETFFDDEFIYEDKSDELMLNPGEIKQMTTAVKRREKAEESFTLAVNHNLARSPQHKVLVEFCGYGKLLSLYRNLISSGEVSFSNRHEMSFFLYHSNLTDQAVKIFGHKFFFCCECCLTINTHRRKEKMDRTETFENWREIHDGKVFFYFDGSLAQEYSFRDPNHAHYKFDSNIKLSDYIGHPFTDRYNPFVLVAQLTLNNVTFTKTIRLDDDWKCLLSNLHFSKNYVQDLIDGDLHKALVATTAGYAGRNLYYDRYLHYIVSSYDFVDFRFVLSFFSWREESLDTQYDDYLTYFDDNLPKLLTFEEDRKFITSLFK